MYRCPCVCVTMSAFVIVEVNAFLCFFINHNVYTLHHIKIEGKYILFIKFSTCFDVYSMYMTIFCSVLQSLSFSLIYKCGTLSRSLDIVCKDRTEFDCWTIGLEVCCSFILSILPISRCLKSLFKIKFVQIGGTLLHNFIHILRYRFAD